MSRRAAPLVLRRSAALLLLGAVLAACGTLAAAADAERCTATATDVFERVAPAVVYVAATSVNPYQLADRMSHVVGSGVLVDRSGLVLTNSHVVFGRQVISVTLDSGARLPAELVGADPILDLAVIRIAPPPGDPLPVARLGDSDRVRVGQDVIVIGNPLGLDQSLTRGVVSAVNRVLPDVPFAVFEPMIQTDAAINPGNSGGPLLDRCGEVIGITTMIMPGASNIGFAVPSNVARAIVPSLLAAGRVVRPWLGFHGQVIDEGVRSVLRAPLVDGLLVEAVEPGSPAERAGIRGGKRLVAVEGNELLIGGDIVTSIDGTPITTPERLVQVVRGLRVGARVTLTVVRDGEARTVAYELPERPLLPGDLPGERGGTLGGRGAWPPRAPADAGRPPARRGP